MSSRRAGSRCESPVAFVRWLSMHISTRIQRCWSQLSGMATRTGEEIPSFLKMWISNDLAHVSSRLEAMVASSNVMQFILHSPASEVPLDGDALVALNAAASSQATTADQEKFFHLVERMLHRIVCPEYDSCWQRQSRRYLVLERDSGLLHIACSCCGHVSSMASAEYVEFASPTIPTRSELARAHQVG